MAAPASERAKIVRRLDAALGIAAVLALSACGEDIPAHQRVVGGDPGLGRALIAGYGCTACHQIPGVRIMSGSVGPSLEGFGRRTYIAGRLPNRPAMLTLWLRDPPAVDPETAMPNVGVSEREARDIAAYLYTLGADRAAVYPPGPQPSPAPRDELRALRTEEERLLNDYERVGEAEARIPIERAMELLVERAGSAAAPVAPAQ